MSPALPAFFLTIVLAAGLGRGPSRMSGRWPRTREGNRNLQGGGRRARGHPAIKWNAALWQVHEQVAAERGGCPRSGRGDPAAGSRRVWDGAHARVDRSTPIIRPGSACASAIYKEGIARKGFDYTIATSRGPGRDQDPVDQGRCAADHRPGASPARDLPAATRTLEEARAAAPGTPQAEEAGG